MVVQLVNITCDMHFLFFNFARNVFQRTCVVFPQSFCMLGGGGTTFQVMRISLQQPLYMLTWVSDTMNHITMLRIVTSSMVQSMHYGLLKRGFKTSNSQPQVAISYMCAPMSISIYALSSHVHKLDFGLLHNYVFCKNHRCGHNPLQDVWSVPFTNPPVLVVHSIRCWCNFSRTWVAHPHNTYKLAFTHLCYYG